MPKVMLYILDSKKYFESVAKIIRTELKNKYVIYVTTNKPYSHLVDVFGKLKIETHNIFYIDCISKHMGEKINEKLENVLFIESPQSLTSLSIAVNESIKHFKGKGVLLLDSLSILLRYNDADTLGRFSNILINKLRALDVDTIILALENDKDMSIIKQIESFVDEVKRYGN
jgi:hypothetical protein